MQQTFALDQHHQQVLLLLLLLLLLLQSNSLPAARKPSGKTLAYI